MQYFPNLFSHRSNFFIEHFAGLVLYYATEFSEVIYIIAITYWYI